eukprot:1082286-Pelagomonas_calceolata.AAC.1
MLYSEVMGTAGWSNFTPCPTNPNRPRTSPLHRVLCSVGGYREVACGTTPARLLHKEESKDHNIHSMEVKFCEDTRPGAQLEASQQQH